MTVCDICKKDKAEYDVDAIIDANCKSQRLELCVDCYRAFKQRENHHRYVAYVETVIAITGEAPYKTYWWDC